MSSLSLKGCVRMPTLSMGWGVPDALHLGSKGQGCSQSFSGAGRSQQVKGLQGQEPAWPWSPWGLGKSQGWRWVRHVPELLVKCWPAHLDFWSVVWVSAAHEH